MAIRNNQRKYDYSRKQTGIRVRGLHELNDNLRKLEKDIALGSHGPVYNALFKAATPMKNSAISHAPHDTGALRENIILIKARKTKPNQSAVQVVIRYNAKRYVDSRVNRNKERVGKEYYEYPAFYARFLEFGTSKMSKRAFLIPAFMETRERFVQLFKKQLWNNLQKLLPRISK